MLTDENMRRFRRVGTQADLYALNKLIDAKGLTRDDLITVLKALALNSGNLEPSWHSPYAVAV